MLGKMKKILMIIIAVFAFFFATNVFAATYTIDKVHTTLGFAVKHLMVSMVRGEFTDYSGEINFDKENLKNFSSEVVIQAQSINTRNDDRDKHLRGADFFDAAQFPTITFKGKKLLQSGKNYTIVGDLTMKAVTKTISIPVSIAGPIKSPMGDEVIGISGEATINRQDFGVSWNKTMDQGGLMIDDHVKLVIEIEAHKK